MEFYVYVDYWFNELALSKSNSFISLAQSRYQKITSRHYISETLNNNHSRIPSMNNGNTYQECKHRLYCLWCSHLKQFISYIFLVFCWDLQLPVQSKLWVPAYVKVYSTHHYVIKFVSEFPQGGGLLRILRFPPPIKLTTTTLLK